MGQFLVYQQQNLLFFLTKSGKKTKIKLNSWYRYLQKQKAALLPLRKNESGEVIIGVCSKHVT